MPIIRVMYWKEIPVQIEFSDKSTKKTIKMDDRFQAAIDSISMSDGSFGSDDYLDGWNWVVKEDSPEILNEEIITNYINFFDNYPKNLIKEIKKMIGNGTRNEKPESIDNMFTNKKE
mgnify:FL=1